LRVTLRRALQDELLDPSPDVTNELVSALEPSVSELVRQQVAAQSDALVDLIEQEIQEAAERVAAEEEARRIAAEKEARRVATEEARRIAAEGEARWIAAEEEARRIAAEEEARRIAAEAEARRITVEEARRVAAEEVRRIAAEEEARRIAAEEEARRIAEEEAQRAAAESPALSESASEKTATPDRNASAPKGCRRLLVLGLVFMLTIASTPWSWSSVSALGKWIAGNGLYQGVVMAAGGEEQQQPPLVPTASVSETGISTKAPSVTSVPQVAATSTAMPAPPATQTPAFTPIASFAKSGFVSQPRQAREVVMSFGSAKSAIYTELLAIRESLVVRAVDEAVADATPTCEATVGEATGEPADKVLYLTFDDGPNARWTPQILEILLQYDAQATFFVIGSEADKRPGLVQTIVDAGHVVGHHTWSHHTLQGVDRATFEAEIESTNVAVDGVVSPYLRAPGGAIDADIRAYADEMGLQVIYWDIDPSDWKLPSAEEIASRVIRRAGPGKIVVLHDGGGDRSQTVAALPVILETLAAQGYVFKAIGQE
jgi:peptidoglycan/xylan/chitin deacetylase (PgdA/CDA1 family)